MGRPRQSCPETEDGWHVALDESVSAVVGTHGLDTVMVNVICTACGAAGFRELRMSELAWTPPKRTEQQALDGVPELTVLKGGKSDE